MTQNVTASRIAVGEVPVAAGAHSVPTEVSVDGDAVRWTGNALGQPTEFRWLAPDPWTLQRFLNASGNPASVRRFVSQYGVLGTQFAGAESAAPTDVMASIARGEEFLYAEPLAAWRALADHAKALLVIAQWLLREELPRREHWDAARIAAERAQGSMQQRFALVYATGGELEYPTALTSAYPPGAWERVAEYVNDLWLRPARLNVEVGVRGQGLEFAYSSTGVGVFGLLAQQLVTAIGRAGGDSTLPLHQAICNGCGVRYDTTRRPPITGAHYCPECREGPIPARIRSARRRRKQQGARLLSPGGE